MSGRSVKRARRLPIWHGVGGRPRRRVRPARRRARRRAAEARARRHENPGTIRANQLSAHDASRARRSARLAADAARRCPLARLGLLSRSAASRRAAGCAHEEYFAGTTIPRSEQNRKIIETVEQYRQRLLARNVEGLLVLASDKYFEDSGTPRSDDDYGYDGLEAGARRTSSSASSRCATRSSTATSRSRARAPRSRCSSTARSSSRADAGDRYRRVNDYHHFVLEQKGDEWKFLSGM